MAPQTLYTAGYSGSKVEDLNAYLDALGASLVDVRLYARSRVACWNLTALKTAIGPDRYVHLTTLGNVNYRNDGPIELNNPEAALLPILMGLEQGPLILVCACKQHADCHRTTAAAWLAQRLGPDVISDVVHLPSRFATWQNAQLELAL
jgi:uncharacterized protein (DUF488 family)